MLSMILHLIVVQEAVYHVSKFWKIIGIIYLSQGAQPLRVDVPLSTKQKERKFKEFFKKKFPKSSNNMMKRELRRERIQPSSNSSLRKIR
jgi:hypothetical protein